MDAHTTSTRPNLNDQTPWPDGVTARIVTRAGMFSRNPNATVDIHDTQPVGEARCRPCGWEARFGLSSRNQVVQAAQEHADQCSGLPNPAHDAPAAGPAIHHSH